MVDGLLGQAVGAAVPPADLDDDERSRGTGIDGHDVELVAADVDVPGEDRPAGIGQAIGDEGLGGIAGLLRRGPLMIAGSVRHRGIVAGTAYPARIGRSGGCRQLQRGEVERVEHRVVGHDGDELARESVIRLRGCRRIGEQVEVELIARERALEGEE